MHIYSIYKATNLSNGKCYIGFAADFNRRIKQHKKYFNKKKTKFYDAIKSYG
jgi:predicted GIY-YIG superfamily endonuclease